LNDLGGLLQHGRRDGQPERLRGLHVDHEDVQRGLLHRQVCRFGAPEDLVHVVRGTAIQGRNSRRIGLQATRFDIVTLASHRRQLRPGRQLDDSASVRIKDRVFPDDDRLSALLHGGGEHWLQALVDAEVEADQLNVEQLHADRGRRILELLLVPRHVALPPAATGGAPVPAPEECDPCC
jgi:hypothetical protein